MGEEVVLSSEDLRDLASLVNDYCKQVSAFMQEYMNKNNSLKSVWKDDETLEPVLNKIQSLTEKIIDMAASVKQRLPGLLEERAKLIDNRPSVTSDNGGKGLTGVNSGGSTASNGTSGNIRVDPSEIIKAHPFAKPECSPIEIPDNPDEIKGELKANGYLQIKYTWNEGGYKYVSRWHTKTPNAPNDYETWVVNRIKHGIPAGPNHCEKIEEVLVGDEWVSIEEWESARSARRQNNATEEQKAILDKGHFHE